jgi:molecular chaperone Hsp33
LTAVGRPEPVDDDVLPFAVDALDARGRVVRLGAASIGRILDRHDYPPAVARLLGEAVALTALIGTALKFEGRFILQTQSDGPVRMLVVDFDTPDKMRACARFDAERVAAAIAAGEDSPEQLMGTGHLAMTVDQGAHTSRYQGIVELDGSSLEAAAHRYFLQSEQIPTRVRLAVSELMTRRADGSMARSWRAGGVLAQFLPTTSERIRPADLHPGDAPEGAGLPAPADEDDAWTEVRSLVDTVGDDELTDPALPSEHLIYRLFHERGARVFDRQPLREECRCTRERIADMIASFTPAERADMVENGRIGVTCEFCSTRYEFDAADFG